MIAVGFQDSPDTNRALEWAAQAAVANDEPLKIISVGPNGAFGDFTGSSVVIDAEVMRSAAVEIAEEGARRARELGAKEITVEGIVGNAAEGIVEAAEGARVLVMGNRGRGPLLSALLGSVSYAVTAHAPCPVIVVRESAPLPDADHRIVVGYDDSEPAQKARDYGVFLSELHDAPVHFVRAWSDTAAALAATSYVDGAALAISDTQAREETKADLQRMIDDLAAEHPKARISGELAEGDAAHAITEAAQGAGLVVVGTRGRGGFKGMMLGSVSHGLLHSAPCPVAIVR